MSTEDENLEQLIAKLYERYEQSENSWLEDISVLFEMAMDLEYGCGDGPGSMNEKQLEDLRQKAQTALDASYAD